MFVDLLDPLVPSALSFVVPHSISSPGGLQMLQCFGMPRLVSFTSMLHYKLLLYDSIYCHASSFFYQTEPVP